MVKKIKFAPMIKHLLVLFFLFTLVNSCKTDFDVIAPYKEVMVIDGLLNPLDSVQYIRVSKAFLGEGNANVMAQQKDSINYADVLDVKLERIYQNNVVETFALSRSELNDKDSGLFAYPFHVLYKTNHVILDDGSSTYRIRVSNSQTGTEAKSLTQIVRAMNVTSPNPNQDSIDFTGTAPSIIRFSPGQYSRLIDLIIRFHYREIDPSGNAVEKSIDMNFTDKSITTTQEIIYYLYKYEWFQNVGSHIPDMPGYVRRIDTLSGGKRPIEVICLAGSEDLQTYIQLQQPTTGIVQELPSFTTVENGLGLFTSRIIKSVYRYPNRLTEIAFDTCSATRNKNFQFH